MVLPICFLGKMVLPDPKSAILSAINSCREDIDVSDSELANYVCELLRVYMDTCNAKIVACNDLSREGGRVLLFKEDG